MASITTGGLNTTVLVGCGKFTVVGNVVTENAVTVARVFELGNRFEKKMKAKLVTRPSASNPITTKGKVLGLYRGLMILDSSFKYALIA